MTKYATVTNDCEKNSIYDFQVLIIHSEQNTDFTTSKKKAKT